MSGFHAIWALVIFISFVFAIIFIFLDERKQMKNKDRINCEKFFKKKET